MDWLVGITLFELAVTSGITLLGWAYQATKSQEMKDLDWARDCGESEVASTLNRNWGPPTTVWDLACENGFYRLDTRLAY